MEEARYESAALRRFVGVDLGIAPAPDETTVLRFRHLLELHDSGGLMQEAVNVHLKARDIEIATGTIVDATTSMHLRQPRTQSALSAKIMNKEHLP